MWFKSIQSWTCTLRAVLPHLEPLGFKSGYDSEWKLYLRLWQHRRQWKHSSSQKNSSYHIIVVSRILDSMNFVNLTVAGNRKTGESLICAVVSLVRFSWVGYWDINCPSFLVFGYFLNSGDFRYGLGCSVENRGKVFELWDNRKPAIVGMRAIFIAACTDQQSNHWKIKYTQKHRQ